MTANGSAASGKKWGRGDVTFFSRAKNQAGARRERRMGDDGREGSGRREKDWDFFFVVRMYRTYFFFPSFV